MYFGYQNVLDIKFVYEYGIADIVDLFRLIWNMLVMVMNIGNMILFMQLSFSYDVNELLRSGNPINSFSLANMYYMA